MFDPPAAGVDPEDAEWRQGPHGTWPLDPEDDPVSDALHRESRAAYMRGDRETYLATAERRYRLIHRRRNARRAAAAASV